MPEMNLSYFPLKEGDTVVDIGATRGDCTMFFSNRVGESGFVLAVEPEEENYLKLYGFLEKYGNIWTAQYAIGDTTGKGVLNIGDTFESHSMMRLFADEGETQEVNVITWDDLMIQAGFTEVTLAKIDAEGSECEFLRGMTTVFPKHILIEEHSRFAYDLEELYDLLREKGYMWTKEDLHIYATR